MEARSAGAVKEAKARDAIRAEADRVAAQQVWDCCVACCGGPACGVGWRAVLLHAAQAELGGWGASLLPAQPIRVPQYVC